MTLLTDDHSRSERDANAAPRRRRTASVWEHQIGPALDAILDAAPRAVVVGNAGSGKSATLRRLHDLLVERSRNAVYAHPGAMNIADVPDAQVLIIDDLHRASPDELAHVRARAANPAAALIVAQRPAVWNEQLAEITQQLERHHPAVVLGHVSRADALAHLQVRGVTLSDACLHHVLEITGGVAWLVAEALRLHDDRDCQGDAGHRELRSMLEEPIAHRIGALDPALRDEIERVCIASPGSSATAADAADLILRAYAEGMLLRSGQPVPLVRTTVQVTMPTGRFAALSSANGASRANSANAATGTSGTTTADATDLADALLRHADLLLPTHPARAAELYESAVRSGVPARSLAERRAAAAWSAGDIDAASALVDAAGPLTAEPVADGGRSADAATNADADARGRLADTSAAIWAARGMMQQAWAVYSAAPPANPISAARGRIAALGIGAAAIETIDDDPVAATSPSTLGVAMSLLRRGLDESVAPEQAEAALADLVRASEMYTTSRTPAGIPELPAVIAAVVALNLGGLTTARSIIDEAIAGEQGGSWARSRLLLWRAWIAVQLARPTEAREALMAAMPTRSPRDALLAHAVHVAIARRYEDAAGLETAWLQARASLLRVDIDLFLLHPLAELISSASRVGDTDRIRPQFQRALAIVERLGDPALWAAHLRWAGIQNGILQNSPESLRPHAKALVAASANSRVAATMAKAGRVWTAVLGGTVDADAVEKAARDLASVGLVWDGARLAGHGAARSEDRKVSSRLLACARELHPLDGSRRAMATGRADTATAESTPPSDILSERELEVARLVVEGKTYAEIGETIFISPRTAEHHIAHIRRRLGANSRSEVIAKLRQLIGLDLPSPRPSDGHPGDPGGPP
ncbi:LuxR C-terminal-related transcriptional regulator [Microbacterium sp.]|uniref:response regulator transcription factor n=1 Tax=Microbacterium sp. TaxID=51671 RepID=UPI003F9D2010